VFLGDCWHCLTLATHGRRPSAAVGAPAASILLGTGTRFLSTRAAARPPPAVNLRINIALVHPPGAAPAWWSPAPQSASRGLGDCNTRLISRPVCHVAYSRAAPARVTGARAGERRPSQTVDWRGTIRIQSRSASECRWQRRTYPGSSAPASPRPRPTPSAALWSAALFSGVPHCRIRWLGANFTSSRNPDHCALGPTRECSPPTRWVVRRYSARAARQVIPPVGIFRALAIHTLTWIWFANAVADETVVIEWGVVPGGHISPLYALADVPSNLVGNPGYLRTLVARTSRIIHGPLGRPTPTTAHASVSLRSRRVWFRGQAWLAMRRRPGPNCRDGETYDSETLRRNAGARDPRRGGCGAIEQMRFGLYDCGMDGEPKYHQPASTRASCLCGRWGSRRRASKGMCF